MGAGRTGNFGNTKGSNETAYIPDKNGYYGKQAKKIHTLDTCPEIKTRQKTFSIK